MQNMESCGVAAKLGWEQLRALLFPSHFRIAVIHKLRILAQVLDAKNPLLIWVGRLQHPYCVEKLLQDQFC